MIWAISASLKKDKRIADSPAGISIHPDVFFISCRYLIGISIPFQPALLKIVRLLDERSLEMQSRRVDRPSDGLSKLGDDHLISLGDDEDGVDKDEEDEKADGAAEDGVCRGGNF